MHQSTWRLDTFAAPIDARYVEPGDRSIGGKTSASDVSPRTATEIAVGSLKRWDQSVRTLVRHRLRGFVGLDGRFEHIISGLAGIIEIAERPAVVEAALVRAIKLMTPASRVELIPSYSADNEHAIESGAGEVPSNQIRGQNAMRTIRNVRDVTNLELRCAGRSSGQLRVRSRSDGPTPLSADTIQQLSTLCTIACCALRTLDRPTSLRSVEPPPLGTTPTNTEHSWSLGSAPDVEHSSVCLHDATFLNAVLPFALSQARRHRESLSVLCIAIDRIRGVQELLGRPAVDRLVRHVGQTTASLIRASDIVARLDDDRIIVVLPRAADESAASMLPRRSAARFAKAASGRWTCRA